MATGAPWQHQDVDSSYVAQWHHVHWAESLRLWTAVGHSQGLQTSPDSKTWTTVPLPGAGPSDEINAAAWMQGATVPLLVIVGESGFVYTSTDGVNYTVGSLPSSPDAQTIAWSETDGVLIVGTLGGDLLRSTNGLDWTTELTGASAQRGLALGDAYVAVGSTGQIRSSADQGDSWTSRTTGGGYSGSFYSATWSRELGLFVIGGGSGEIQTSADGTTWASSATLAGNMTGVDWSPVDSLFFAVNDSGAIWTSPDAVTWTSRIAAADFALAFLSIAVGRSEVVAVGSAGEIQTTEVVRIEPKHAANFQKLLPPGAAWGNN